MSLYDNEPIATAIEHFQASRYITAAGVAMLLYDHFLTFSEEVQFIWRAKWRAPKILFLLVRYIVPVGVILHSHQLSGIANSDVTDTYCKVVFSLVLMLSELTTGMGNFLVMLHVWNLWERNRILIVASLILFTLTQIANIICGVISVINITSIVSFSILLKACTLSRKTSLVYLWAPGLLFELAMFAAVYLNAGARPRTLQTEFSKVLHRDGMVYFAVLLTLRLTNLVLAIVSPLSLIFLAVFFVWCSTTVTVTRLMLRLRRVSVDNALRRESDASSLELKYMGDRES